MGCGCGQKRKTTIYVLSFDDDRKGSEHATRTDAEVANARAGGGGIVRPVQR